MDRKDELIQLQMEVIAQMNQSNLNRIATDLWGSDQGKSSSVDASESSDSTKVKTGDEIKSDKEKDEIVEEIQSEPIEKLFEELNSYIGLESVKREVESLVNVVKVQQMRKQHNLPIKDMSLHLVFTGNPGTGKTMIARMMARIYKSLNLLSKGQLVEIDRSGLVAGYVGQTALKTSEVIKKAMGGVLFIDEAYTLTNRGGTDYGQEAVDTLLKAMEDHRDDLVVIVAGYIEPMNDFIRSNPGLESRFNRFLNFEDYSVDELMGIFELKAKQSGYKVAEDAKESLLEMLAMGSESPKTFGNGRGVRNLFEHAITEQANRLATAKAPSAEMLMQLTNEDFVAVREVLSGKKDKNSVEDN